MLKHKHNLAREGALTGVIGASVVALWFFVIDVMAGHPLATPNVLGEVFVFVFFGLVAVAGTAFVQVGRLTPTALGAAVPVGLLCTAILIVNNLRDVETDRAADKHTLAVLLGPAITRGLYLGVWWPPRRLRRSSTRRGKSGRATGSRG